MYSPSALQRYAAFVCLNMPNKYFVWFALRMGSRVYIQQN